ncbi:MAG: NAD(P)-dependent alcohol dehydrogenase [Chitinophagales bacterium]
MSNAVAAWGASAAGALLKPMTIQRREVMPFDIEMEIMFCGICHSDLHVVKNDWGATQYPVVPGHEILGRVVRVGSEVTQFQPGDWAGVGCIVDSCRNCAYCQEGNEQFCENGWTVVFNAVDKKYGGITYGGFSKKLVVDARYAVLIPEALRQAAAAPILCAGITVYSPLRHWQAGAGKKVGIMGMGGLGHMAIKMARAMGAEVTVFTTSAKKTEDALRLGAHHVVVTTDAQQMKTVARQDMLLDTISAPHEVNAFLRLLKVDGAMVLVGLPNEPLMINGFSVVSGRRSFAGSNIGGIAETQEAINFCAHHRLLADVEIISPDELNQAFERLEKGDVKYRFVIDMHR